MMMGTVTDNLLRMSELVPAARFYCREEVDAFLELAIESGMRALLLEPEQVGRGFDILLGEVERMVAFAGMLHPDDWEAMETRLEAVLELDPLDPVAASPAPELQALLAGPRDANLPERAVARKVLAVLPPQAVLQTAASLDVHKQGDEKLGGWLTMIAVLSSRIFIGLMLALAKPWGVHHLCAYGLTPRSGAEGIYREAMEYRVDPFAAPVKSLFPLIFPFPATLAVIISRRRLKDGRVRRMFPRAQR